MNNDECYPMIKDYEGDVLYNEPIHLVAVTFLYPFTDNYLANVYPRLYVSSELYDDMFAKYEGVQVPKLYSKFAFVPYNKSLRNETKKNLNFLKSAYIIDRTTIDKSDVRFALNDNIQTSIEHIAINYDYDANIIIAVGGAIGLISILLIIYYSTGLINQNIRKIGIFRALGASKADIIKMFLFSGMMFALLAFALALSVNLVGINVINAHYLSILLGNDYIPHAVSYFTYGFRQFGITFGLIFGAFLLSSLIPILKLMKKQPIDIIANRK